MWPATKMNIAVHNMNNNNNNNDNNNASSKKILTDISTIHLQICPYVSPHRPNDDRPRYSHSPSVKDSLFLFLISPLNTKNGFFSLPGGILQQRNATVSLVWSAVTWLCRRKSPLHILTVKDISGNRWQLKANLWHDVMHKYVRPDKSQCKNIFHEF